MLYSFSEKIPTGEIGQMPAIGDEVKSAARAIHHDRQVENAEIVLALIDRHADLAGAKAAVDCDVEAALFPEAHLLWQ